MITRNAVAFAKLPTGEITVVLGFTVAKRTVTVGTRRKEKFKAAEKTKFKVINMYADSLVFQTGFVRADGTGRADNTDPSWYDPWECSGNDWKPFDVYYEGWEDAPKKDEKGEKATTVITRTKGEWLQNKVAK